MFSQYNARSIKTMFGFTLLEVMVALAVLAIAGISLMGASREGLVNSQYLSTKRPAYWVAENTLTDIHLSQTWPSETWQESTQSLANRTWHIRSRSIKTVTTGLRAIEVEVRNDKSSTAPLAQLQTHMYLP